MLTLTNVIQASRERLHKYIMHCQFLDNKNMIQFGIFDKSTAKYISTCQINIDNMPEEFQSFLAKSKLLEDE